MHSRRHFAKITVLSGHVPVRHVSSEDSQINWFTKPLITTKFENFRSMVCTHSLLLVASVRRGGIETRNSVTCDSTITRRQ